MIAQLCTVCGYMKALFRSSIGQATDRSFSMLPRVLITSPPPYAPRGLVGKKDRTANSCGPHCTSSNICG